MTKRDEAYRRELARHERQRKAIIVSAALLAVCGLIVYFWTIGLDPSKWDTETKAVLQGGGMVIGLASLAWVFIKFSSRPQSPQEQDADQELIQTIIRTGVTALVQRNATVDAVQTSKGSVIVEWVSLDPAASLADTETHAATMRRTSQRISDVLKANPDTDLLKSAGSLGIEVLRIERSWQRDTGSSNATGSKLLDLLSKTDDPDEAHVIFEKYKKDRGIEPGSDREARARAIFSEYVGRLLDPDSE